MVGTTNMNIILGQGDAVKEIHNVKKQNLELNQQFAAQETEDRKKEAKEKVEDLRKGSRLEIKGDEEKSPGEDPGNRKKDSKKKKSKKKNPSSEGSLLDITV
jgi:hypothetical protein